MAEDHFVARDIQVRNELKHVEVQWGDGHRSSIPIQLLRGFCPCATCQGHGGKIAWVDNETHGISAAELVGSYGIQFFFNDGHDTGIYRWEHLRQLDPTEEDRWGPPEQSLNTT